jgi:hypothetical protein
LATSKGNPNLANSRGKIKGVKKVSIRNDKFIEKPKKQSIFYVRITTIRLILYPELHFLTNQLIEAIPRR